MSKKIIVILSVVLICIIAIWLYPKIKISLNIDSCLNQGGKWNYELNSCTYSAPDSITKPEIVKRHVPNADTINWDQVIEELEIMINDPEIDSLNLATLTRIMEETKKKPSSLDSLFPYSEFDSVMFFRHSKVDEFITPVEERELIVKYRMSNEKALKLLNIINNPLNFGGGVCGTAIPSERVAFYKDNKIIAEIQFSCARGTITTTPDNKLIMGMINANGDQLIRSLKIKIN